MTTRELAYLQATRRHVLGAIEGLDDEALRRPVLPSGWSCLGLLRHLTLDVERFWFGAVVAAEPELVAFYESDPEDGWRVPDDARPKDVIAAYRDAAERSDAIVSATPGDTPPQWWPGDAFGDWRVDNLDEVVLHVIVENSTHAGHLDAARELLDGRQWLVLT